MPRIGIVAGEPSGDALGGDLIEALRRQCPQLEVEGIGGPRMQAAGCRSLYPLERLSVMGLVEVLGRWRELHGIRAGLARHFRARPPDLFIGVDAPDFNLGLERQLRGAGIRTAHLVSPSVWAWRRWRLRGIARAVDLMLALFPFEEEFYRAAGIPVRCVGHPLADRIALEPDRAAARARLGCDPTGKLVALLPGSRWNEIEQLAGPFLLAAERLHRQRPGLRFAASLLHAEGADFCRAKLRALGLDDLPLELHVDRAHDLLEACDAALLASGTVTLEAMLFKRPMVVAYRLHPLSYRLLRTMVSVPFVALPNLLAGARIVPECLQQDCTPERLCAELARWLDDAAAVAAFSARCTELHGQLRRGAADRAAGALLELLH